MGLVEKLDAIPLEVDPKNSKTTSSQPRWTVWITKDIRDRFLERKAALAPSKTHGHFIELLLAYKDSIDTDSTMFPPTPPTSHSLEKLATSGFVHDDKSFRNRYRSNSIAINRPTPVTESYSRSFEPPSRTASHPPPPRLHTNSPVSRPNSSPYSSGHVYPGQGYFFAERSPQSPYRVPSYTNNAFSPLVNSYSFAEELNENILTPEANHPSPFLQQYANAIPIQQHVNQIDISMHSPPFMIDNNLSYPLGKSYNSPVFDFRSPSTHTEGFDIHHQTSMQQFAQPLVEPDLQKEHQMYPLDSLILPSEEKLWQNDFPDSYF